MCVCPVGVGSEWVGVSVCVSSGCGFRVGGGGFSGCEFRVCGCEFRVSSECGCEFRVSSESVGVSSE